MSCKPAGSLRRHGRSHGDHRHGYSSLVRASGVLAGRAGQAGAAGRSHSRPASSNSGSRSRSRTRLSSRPPATAPPSSGSCDLSSSAWSWRIREWFGRSPMPGLRRTRSTRSILARLHAGGFLPEVWVADDNTQRQRRQTVERMGVLEQVVRTKGRIHAILHANLIPKYSGHLFGKAGKKWLAGLPLPEEEKAIVGRLVDELERNSDQLAKLDMAIIREALEDPRVVRLMTIPGIGPVVASTISASIGDISRFETPEKLSCYFGLTPNGSPIRRSPCAPRTDQQAGKHARPQDACRGGVVREDGARSVEGVLSTGPAKSGCARGGGRDSEKTGSDDLACSDGWDGVRLRAARLHRHEATQSSAQSWRSARSMARRGQVGTIGSRRSGSGKSTTCGVLSRPTSEWWRRGRKSHPRLRP